MEYAGKFGSNRQYPALPWHVANCADKFVAAFGTGSRTGFDLSYEVGAIVNKAATDFICQAETPNSTTFENAYAHARRKMMEIFPLNDELWEVASSTLLCMVIQNSQANIAWRGNEEAFLIRQGRIVHQTTGHFQARIHPEVLNNSLFEPKKKRFFFGMPMKLLHVEYEETTPEIIPSSWAIQGGDYLVLTTSKCLKDDFVVDHLPDCVTGKTAEDAVQSVIQNAAENSGWSVAIVIRAVED